VAVVSSKLFVCGILPKPLGSGMTGTGGGLTRRVCVGIDIDFHLTGFGEGGGLISSLSMAFDLGKKGVFPKNVLVLGSVFLFLSWNAGGGEIIGVTGGGEKLSGWGDGDFFRSNSRPCRDR
jgi:hypothetical protein